MKTVKHTTAALLKLAMSLDPWGNLSEGNFEPHTAILGSKPSIDRSRMVVSSPLNEAMNKAFSGLSSSAAKSGLIPTPTSGPIGSFQGSVSTGGDNRLSAVGQEAKGLITNGLQATKNLALSGLQNTAAAPKRFVDWAGQKLESAATR